MEGLIFLKILILIFSSILFFGIIYFLLKTEWLKRIFLQDLIEFLTFRPYGIGRYLKIWSKIKKRMEKEIESEAKLAIIEADDLLNEVLKAKGYKGESLGERLEKSKEIFSNFAEISQAHKIRSNIVHDPSYKLNLDEAKKILKIYEKALLDLEAI